MSNFWGAYQYDVLTSVSTRTYDNEYAHLLLHCMLNKSVL